MSLSLSAQRELRDLINELETLSSKPGTITPEERRRIDVLKVKISAVKSGSISDELRNAEVDQLMREVGLSVQDRTAEGKARQEERATLRKVLSNESGYELRTYTPLGTGSALTPQQFIKKLSMAQMSAGPLYAGSPVLTNVTTDGPGSVAKLPLVDDTSNDGYEVGESAAETEVNPITGNASMTLRKFSSGIIQYSMELAQDVTEFDSLTGILARALGARLGRAQNVAFLATLMTALEANSSAVALSSETSGVVTYDDCASLVGSVSGAYRLNASFIMNSGTATLLAKLKDSTGRPYLRDVLGLNPTLLNFPVFISDFADDVATDNHPILFGDFSTVYCRHTDGFGIETFTERFIDQGMYALLARKRSTIAYGISATSDSAIKMLTIS